MQRTFPCIIKNCCSRKKLNYSFHRFPTDPTLLKKWNKAVKNYLKTDGLKYSLICGEHFEKSCFTLKEGPRTKLKKDSVPSIFDNEDLEARLLENNVVPEFSKHHPKVGKYKSVRLRKVNKYLEQPEKKISIKSNKFDKYDEEIISTIKIEENNFESEVKDNLPEDLNKITTKIQNLESLFISKVGKYFDAKSFLDSIDESVKTKNENDIGKLKKFYEFRVIDLQERIRKIKKHSNLVKLEQNCNTKKEEFDFLSQKHRCLQAFLDKVIKQENKIPIELKNIAKRHISGYSAFQRKTNFDIPPIPESEQQIYNPLDIEMVELNEPKYNYIKVENGYQCEKCFKVLPKLCSYSAHLETHHEYSLLCYNCGSCFEHHAQLVNHNRIFKTRGYCLNSEKLLNVNVKRNKGTKPIYNCKVCQKVFSSSLVFAKHSLNDHNIERPFQCDKCSRNFDHLHALHGHRRRSHTLLNKLKRCILCGDNKLYKANAFKYHKLRYHKRHYECPRCDEILLNYTALLDHKKMVHNVKGYIPRKKHCKVCNVTYTNSRIFLEHFSNENHKELELNWMKDFNIEKFDCYFCEGIFFDDIGKTYIHTINEHRKYEIKNMDIFSYFESKNSNRGLLRE